MPSVLALDPGVHLGYALIPQGEVGTLVLPQEPVEAVRAMMGRLQPLFLQADRLVVEGWEVRGRRPGKASLVPLALLGGLVALGAEVVSPRWKRDFAPRVPLGVRVSFPSGLDETDRGVWLRLYLDGWLPLLERVRTLPRGHRPHALDALGLARYSTLRLAEEVLGHAL